MNDLDFTSVLELNISGKFYERIEAKKSESVELPNVPVDEGYIFEGWYREPEYLNKAPNPLLPGDYSHWMIKLFGKISAIDTRLPKVEKVSTYLQVNKEGEGKKTGQYLLFGEYPQKIKSKEVIIGNEKDDRGYYLGSDGCYYSKVVVKKPSCENKNNLVRKRFSTGAVIEYGKEYYFKVEPIKWRVLEEMDGNAVIMCDSIIEAMFYYESSEIRTLDGETIYANNYKHSSVRSWLNNEFFNVAFSEKQKKLIEISEVDNSPESTGLKRNQFACENTFDKIFLASCKDVTNKKYGFVTGKYAKDKKFIKQTSDYSRANGAAVGSRHNLYGFGPWWLRSPSVKSEYFFRPDYGVQTVLPDGLNAYYVFDLMHGIVPMLKMQLS